MLKNCFKLKYNIFYVASTLQDQWEQFILCENYYFLEIEWFFIFTVFSLTVSLLMLIDFSFIGSKIGEYITIKKIHEYNVYIQWNIIKNVFIYNFLRVQYGPVNLLYLTYCSKLLYSLGKRIQDILFSKEVFKALFENSKLPIIKVNKRG